MNLQPLHHLVAEFTAGRLDRKEYWIAMQRHHRQLLDYRDLVSRAKLAGIEIRPEELLIVLRNGLKLGWDPEDIRTAPNILLNHGAYEPDELVLMKKLTEGAHVVLDIGANIGWYTLHLAHWLEPNGGQVFAVEPLPPTFQTLSQNMAINRCGKVVRAFCVSLADEIGTTTFYLPDFTGSVAASRRTLFPEEQSSAFQCPVTTLDQFVHDQNIPRIDFLKCDVEGSELAVLQGGLSSLKTYRPVIMIEMLRKWSACFGYSPNAIIELLTGIGYECGFYDGSQFCRVTDVDENCARTNFVFLHQTAHLHLRQIKSFSG